MPMPGCLLELCSPTLNFVSLENEWLVYTCLIIKALNCTDRCLLVLRSWPDASWFQKGIVYLLPGNTTCYFLLALRSWDGLVFAWRMVWLVLISLLQSWMYINLQRACSLCSSFSCNRGSACSSCWLCWWPYHYDWRWCPSAVTDVARQIGLDGVQYLVLALLCEFFLFFRFSIGPKMYIETSVVVFREMSYYVDIIERDELLIRKTIITRMEA